MDADDAYLSLKPISLESEHNLCTNAENDEPAINMLIKVRSSSGSDGAHDEITDVGDDNMDDISGDVDGINATDIELQLHLHASAKKSSKDTLISKHMDIKADTATNDKLVVNNLFAQEMSQDAIVTDDTAIRKRKRQAHGIMSNKRTYFTDAKSNNDNGVLSACLDYELTQKLEDMDEISLNLVSPDSKNIKSDYDLGDKESLELSNNKSFDDTEDKRKITNLRKNIRDVMDDNQLDASTLAAQRQELERLARVQEQQKQIRDTQRQIAMERQNSKTQNRVLSLLQASVTLTPSVSISSITQNHHESCNTNLENDCFPKSENVGISSKTQYKNPTIIDSSASKSATHKDINKVICDNIPVGRPDVTATIEDDENQEYDQLSANIANRNIVEVKNDIVHIVDSSDDDCILLSDDEDEQDNDDPHNSGLHVNDTYNQPDDQGRIAVNIGHADGEEDIYVAPQIARVMKPHQIGGVRFLFDNIIESLDRFTSSDGFGCILAHSMGLGKTLQLVCFSDIFLRHTQSKTILCIMPINTLQNWMAEFNMWLPEEADVATSRAASDGGEVRPRNFNLFVLNDTHKTLQARAKVVQEWSKHGGVLLMGYELYRLLSMKKVSKRRGRKGSRTAEQEQDQQEAHKQLLDEMHAALVKPGPDLCVCDEGHRIKNSHAGISIALKQMRSKRRIVLTGYPLQNNLLEYWCMVDFVRPNYLGTKTEFCNMFERPILNGQCIDSTPQDIKLMRYRAHVLHSLLLGFVQRRSHVVLQQSLPIKEEFVLMIRMTEFQRRLYDVFMNEIVRTKAVPNPLKAFSVCCKIWNHPDVLHNFLKKREIDLDIEETEATVGDTALELESSTNAIKSTQKKKENASKKCKATYNVSASLPVDTSKNNSTEVASSESQPSVEKKFTDKQTDLMLPDSALMTSDMKTDNVIQLQNNLQAIPYNNGYPEHYGQYSQYDQATQNSNYYHNYSNYQNSLYPTYGSYLSSPYETQQTYTQNNTVLGQHSDDYWNSQNAPSTMGYYNGEYGPHIQQQSQSINSENYPRSFNTHHNFNSQEKLNYFNNYNGQILASALNIDSSKNNSQSAFDSISEQAQTPSIIKESQICDLDTNEIKMENSIIHAKSANMEYKTAPSTDPLFQSSNTNLTETTTSNDVMTSDNGNDVDLLKKDCAIAETASGMCSSVSTNGSSTTISKPTKSEDGIPYEWAVELMKNYVPDLLTNSPKMEIFLCILEETLRQKDRLLVFSQSLLTLNVIEKFLQGCTVNGSEQRWARNINYFRLDGSTAAMEREKLINEFNVNLNVHLFLVSTRAGSLGINLVGANRVVVFDASWNPCHDTQAVCRVYRYGQKKPCYVYRLVMDSCLEKKIYDRQVNKQGMSDRVVDESNPDAHLSMKEVTNLCYNDDKQTEIKDFADCLDKYTDVATRTIITKFSHLMTKEPFQHETLLIDRKDKKLSMAEKRLAQRGYELEKQAAIKPNFLPNGTSGLQQYRTVRRPDGVIFHRPVASVRPVQASPSTSGGIGMLRTAIGPNGVFRQTRWIPAEVWQRQGMTAQVLTLPGDVVIPTSSAEKSSIVLKEGQKVMVLKSPKGIYMQLESGKIIAIRTTFKVGNGTTKEKTDSSTEQVTTPSKLLGRDFTPRPKQNLTTGSNMQIAQSGKESSGGNMKLASTVTKRGDSASNTRPLLNYNQKSQTSEIITKSLNAVGTERPSRVTRKSPSSNSKFLFSDKGENHTSKPLSISILDEDIQIDKQAESCRVTDTVETNINLASPPSAKTSVALNHDVVGGSTLTSVSTITSKALSNNRLNQIGQPFVYNDYSTGELEQQAQPYGNAVSNIHNSSQHLLSFEQNTHFAGTPTMTIDNASKAPMHKEVYSEPDIFKRMEQTDTQIDTHSQQLFMNDAKFSQKAACTTPCTDDVTEPKKTNLVQAPDKSSDVNTLNNVPAIVHFEHLHQPYLSESDMDGTNAQHRLKTLPLKPVTNKKQGDETQLMKQFNQFALKSNTQIPNNGYTTSLSLLRPTSHNPYPQQLQPISSLSTIPQVQQPTSYNSPSSSAIKLQSVGSSNCQMTETEFKSNITPNKSGSFIASCDTKNSASLNPPYINNQNQAPIHVRYHTDPSQYQPICDNTPLRDGPSHQFIGSNQPSHAVPSSLTFLERTAVHDLQSAFSSTLNDITRPPLSTNAVSTQPSSLSSGSNSASTSPFSCTTSAAGQPLQRQSLSPVKPIINAISNSTKSKPKSVKSRASKKSVKNSSPEVKSISSHNINPKELLSSITEKTANKANKNKHISATVKRQVSEIATSRPNIANQSLHSVKFHNEHIPNFPTVPFLGSHPSVAVSASDSTRHTYEQCEPISDTCYPKGDANFMGSKFSNTQHYQNNVHEGTTTLKNNIQQSPPLTPPNSIVVGHPAYTLPSMASTALPAADPQLLQLQTVHTSVAVNNPYVNYQQQTLASAYTFPAVSAQPPHHPHFSYDTYLGYPPYQQTVLDHTASAYHSLAPAITRHNPPQNLSDQTSVKGTLTTNNKISNTHSEHSVSPNLANGPQQHHHQNHHLQNHHHNLQNYQHSQLQHAPSSDSILAPVQSTKHDQQSPSLPQQLLLTATSPQAPLYQLGTYAGAPAFPVSSHVYETPLTATTSLQQLDGYQPAYGKSLSPSEYSNAPPYCALPDSASAVTYDYRGQCSTDANYTEVSTTTVENPIQSLAHLPSLSNYPTYGLQPNQQS